MEDYKKIVLAKPVTAKSAARAQASADRKRDEVEKRANAAPLREKIKAIEAAMEKLQAIIADLDEKLGRPGLFERSPDKAVEMTKARAVAAERLALAEDAWLTAQAELEAAA
jgi:ATP-binding cassette subfamily F protein 3